MLPTEEQVQAYIIGHPGCTSKDIAKHFDCTSSDINRKREGYRGVYALPDITHRDHLHYSEDAPLATAIYSYLLDGGTPEEILELAQEIGLQIAGNK